MRLREHPDFAAIVERLEQLRERLWLALSGRGTSMTRIGGLHAGRCTRSRTDGRAALRSAAALTLLAGAMPSFAQERAFPDLAEARPVFCVEVRGRSVADVLRRISAASHLTIEAAGAVADAKIVVLGPPRPLQATLTDIAELLGCKWDVREVAGGERSYRLTELPSTSKRRRALQDAQVDYVVRELDRLADGLRLTPDELDRLPEDDPVRNVLASDSRRVGVELYAALSRERRVELVHAGSLPVIPFRALPIEARTRLEDYVRQSNRQADEFTAQHSQTSMPVVVSGLRPDPAALECSGFQFVRTTRRLVLKMIGRVGLDVAQWDPGSLPVCAIRGTPYAEEATPPLGDLPTADAVRAALRETEWLNRLKTLAESTGRSVVADYYRCRPVPGPKWPAGPLRDGDAGAALLLDDLCSKEGALWWLSSGSVFLRSRNWFSDDLNEVPDAWTDHAVAQSQAHGGVPTFGDVLAIGDLSPEQIVGLARVLQISLDEVQVPGTRELLAFVKAAGVLPGRRIALGGSPEARQPVVLGSIAAGRAPGAWGAFSSNAGGAPIGDLSALRMMFMYSRASGDPPRFQFVCANWDYGQSTQGDASCSRLMVLPVRSLSEGCALTIEAAR